MAKDEPLELSDKELAVVQRYAETHGLTIEEAASEMASRGLEKKMRRTKRRPAKNVVDFRQKKTRQ